MPSKKKRYVFYKTDEWNHPIYWQWFSVSVDYKVDWAKQTHFCTLFSDFTMWEAIYDTSAKDTKLENMAFIAGFESKEMAIKYGAKKGWMKAAGTIPRRRKAA